MKVITYFDFFYIGNANGGKGQRPRRHNAKNTKGGLGIWQ